MFMSDTSADLLELICSTSKCGYLSDLHDASRHKQVFAALEKIDPDSFPVSQWLTAAEYITGKTPAATSAYELRSFILSCLHGLELSHQ